PYSQHIASSSLYASESEKLKPGRSGPVVPSATRSKLASQPSRSNQVSQWGSVAAALVVCIAAQKPPVKEISASPSGRSSPRDGTTGRPPYLSIIAIYRSP